MKTTKKIFLIALLAVLSLPTTFAQTTKVQKIREAEKKPLPTEKKVGGIWKYVQLGSRRQTKSGWTFDGKKYENTLRDFTEEELYDDIVSTSQYRDCQRKYPDEIIRIRNLKWPVELLDAIEEDPSNADMYSYYFFKRCIYEADFYIIPEGVLHNTINKALENIREGSRLAIDQIKVEENEDKEELKDMIVEHLLDKGYKVVAKEYLEKLYEEQQAQKSGIYNDRTTVKENNFSAVGFYISIRKNKTNTYVQVVNVSTGEYEGVSDMSESQDKLTQNLSQAVNKGLSNVNEGCRIAIDQVSVLSNVDKEELKQRIIKVLLDKGYRVIAKEYMEKLYEDQKGQQSGIYNEKTLVQENNFSAVGYYLNAKLTDNTLRIQVVNVSTGEYEGNTTIKF